MATSVERPEAPRLTAADAERVARECFGVCGEARALDSYVDQNFRVEDEDSRRVWVLKIAHAGEDPGALALQQEILTGLNDVLPGLAPRLRPAGQDALGAEIQGPDGQTHHAWMVEFLGGPLLADAPQRDALTWHGLGELLAQLHLAMEACPLSPAAREAAGRWHRWDLSHAAWTVGRLPASLSASECAQLRFHQAQFLGHVRPRLAALPAGLTHHDANDRNLLVRPGGGPARVAHVFDFGDMVHGPRVFDLAIAAAYAVLGSDQPEAVLQGLAAGYHSILPLMPQELEVLAPALAMRLVVSATVAAEDRVADPDNAYLSIHQAPLWDCLQILANWDHEAIAAGLQSATGLEPRTQTPAARPPLSRDQAAGLRAKHVGPSLSLSYSEPLEIAAGRGTYLFDKRGRAYLDCVNNVCHVGHCHPHVVAAGQAQMARLNTNTRYLHDNLGTYAERLAGLLPDPLEVVYLVNSGSEANELALRIARAATGRHNVLAVEAGYHGHTQALIDISHYKHGGKGGAGTPDWVRLVPLPDPYRGRYRADSPDPLDVRGDEALGQRYAVHVAEAAAGFEPAAMIAEALIGCGGQVVPPPGWLRSAFEHARAAGAVCIADEVQVGFGRIGSHLWAFEAQGAVPDIVTLGKPIGNGHPMAAVVTTRALADAFDNGMEYFATFGGNPVSCATGMAVLDVIEAEDLRENAARAGDQLIQGFRELAANHPAFQGRFGTVRGMGLYLGVEVVTDSESREPDAAFLAQLIDRAKDRGVLLSADGPQNNVLKIKPPMVFSEADARLLLDVLAAD